MLHNIISKCTLRHLFNAVPLLFEPIFCSIQFLQCLSIRFFTVSLSGFHLFSYNWGMKGRPFLLLGNHTAAPFVRLPRVVFFNIPPREGKTLWCSSTGFFSFLDNCSGVSEYPYRIEGWNKSSFTPCTIIHCIIHVHIGKAIRMTPTYNFFILYLVTSGGRNLNIAVFWLLQNVMFKVGSKVQWRMNKLCVAHNIDSGSWNMFS